jgi:DNA-binding Lrp family transcriptional regulator
LTLADDALALLSYVEKAHPQNQTERTLSKATGIPATTIRRLLNDAEGSGRSILAGVAHKYGFQFRVFKERKSRAHKGKQLLDVVRAG